MDTVKLEKLMRDNYAHTSHKTHVSMVQPKGSFQFDRCAIETMWEAYINKFSNDKNAIMGLAEKPQQYMPILVDIDIKIPSDMDIEYEDHLYSVEQLDRMIEIYQEILRDIIEDCSDKDLCCVVLEKDIYSKEYNKTKYIKNGFHLHFPGIFLHVRDHVAQLIPRVKERVKKLELFSDLCIEDSSSVVDDGYCKAPWLMYGCRKSEELDPYVVTRVVNFEGEDISLEKAFSNYLLYDTDENPIKIGKNVEKYLPRILSIFSYGRKTCETRNGLISPLKETLKAVEKKKLKNKKLDRNAERDLKAAEQLIPMLSTFRTTEYREWINVGWVLYNIGEGSEKAYDIWLEFSATCEDKYDETRCLYEWSKMHVGGYTLGTLCHFAKTDNPEAYSQYKLERAEEHVKESLTGSHTDIAMVLKAEYGDEFVCSSVNNKTWYQFRDHRWEDIEGGVFLRKKISDIKYGIAKKYKDLGISMWKDMGGDKADEANLQSRIKQVARILQNLRSAPYKANIMKEAVDEFYDRNFKSKLNQNKYLIGFKNGVYDLKSLLFRPGRPQDYISKTLPIEYINHTHDDEAVQNVEDFLSKVFPDNSVRKYFLDVYSDIFVGGNSMKKIFFWTGNGDNAKSVTQMFFDEMLGELGIKFDTTMFSGKKNNNGSASPEMARAAPPVRHVTADEPENGETFNTSRLKSLSGNDKYWARDLFEKGKEVREVTPMFMITIICNKLPGMNRADEAYFNRTRVIPFEATFCDDAPSTFEEQLKLKRFPKDEKFSDKVPGMITAFAWLRLSSCQSFLPFLVLMVT